MLRDSDLWNFWLMYVCVMNTSSGPQSENTRWNELNAAWEEMTSLHLHECPLFLDRVDRLLAERGGSKAVGEGSAAEALWQQLRQDGPLRYVERVNLVRFWDAPQRAREMLERWQSDLLNRGYLALEWRHDERGGTQVEGEGGS